MLFPHLFILCLYLTSISVIGRKTKKKARHPMITRNENIKPRIVGGTQSGSMEFPWMTSLQKDSLHFCGATLISDQWVVTAAHCADQEEHKKATVVFGEYRLEVEESTERHFYIENIILHERWSAADIKNDIALIKLSKKLDFKIFDKHIKPIDLPNKNFDIFDGLECVASGWGKTSAEERALPEVLQKVTLEIYDHKECDHLYEGANPITEGNLCAGGKVGKSICFGDSGGPLQCYINGKWNYIGLSSWTRRCGEEPLPSVFTDIMHYSDWIKKKIAKN